MTKEVKDVISVRQGYQLKRLPSTSTAKCESGLSTSYKATVIFDTSANDRTGASNNTVASHPMGVYLPLGAIITKMTYQVKTAFTSVDSTATVAVTAQSAGDLLAAVAVSGAPGSTGFKAGIPDGTVTYMISLTAEREITVPVAVEALTAGKLVMFIEYVIGL